MENVAANYKDHWDDKFRAQSWGRYPPEDLVRFMDDSRNSDLIAHGKTQIPNEIDREFFQHEFDLENKFQCLKNNFIASFSCILFKNVRSFGNILIKLDLKESC